MILTAAADNNESDRLYLHAHFSEMVAGNIFVALLTIVVTAAYFYIKRSHSYSDRRGVKSIKPTFPSGNLGNIVKQKLSTGQLVTEFYRNHSERFIALYSFLRPTQVLRDSELIRNVCGRDEKNDPMATNVFAVNGKKWKNIREKLSPAFMTGKLKEMFEASKNSGRSLHKYMDRFADTNEPVDVHEVFVRFAINVVGSVAFGIDVDCIQNSDDEFYTRGMQVIHFSLKHAVRFMVTKNCPAISRLFKIRFSDRENKDFMTSLIKENARH